MRLDDFGIRSMPPCGDCYEDGHCSMNCSRTIHFEECAKCDGTGILPAIARLIRRGPCDGCNGTGYVEVPSEPVTLANIEEE